MQMPGRIFAAGSYRFGFQGQEKDDEIKGEGNSINYKFRMHDPRLGRFFAVDPLAPKFPWWTPYQFSGNIPIWAREYEGLEPVYTTGNALDGPEYMDVELTHAAHIEAHVSRAQSIHSAEAVDAKSFQEMITPLKVAGEVGAGFTPVGVCMDGADAVYNLKQGDYIAAGISAVFLIPGLDVFKPYKNSAGKF